jgi:hypothetical protein
MKFRISREQSRIELSTSALRTRLFSKVKFFGPEPKKLEFLASLVCHSLWRRRMRGRRSQTVHQGK